MQLREPQQARAHATRVRLVDAAAECLASHGFQATTTQAVAARAGVSQGALFKHFPSKASLLAASVAHVLARLVDDFRNDPEVARGDGDLDARIGPAVRALFRIFRRPEMHAVFEVYVAARTDAALGQALAPILERHRARILEQAANVFPELAAQPSFEGAVDAVVYAMQGAVIGLFAADERADAQHLALFERLARNELAITLMGEDTCRS